MPCPDVSGPCIACWGFNFNVDEVYIMQFKVFTAVKNQTENNEILIMFIWFQLKGKGMNYFDKVCNLVGQIFQC